MFNAGQQANLVSLQIYIMNLFSPSSSYISYVQLKVEKLFQCALWCTGLTYQDLSPGKLFSPLNQWVTNACS